MEVTQPGDDLYRYDEEFRDHIATVDEKGKRIWLFPKKPGGTLHQWRVVVTVLLLSLFFSGPFLKIGGRPLLLLNIFERKFVATVKFTCCKSQPFHRGTFHASQLFSAHRRAARRVE